MLHILYSFILVPPLVDKISNANKGNSCHYQLACERFKEFEADDKIRSLENDYALVILRLCIDVCIAG